MTRNSDGKFTSRRTISQAKRNPIRAAKPAAAKVRALAALKARDEQAERDRLWPHGLIER